MQSIRHRSERVMAVEARQGQDMLALHKQGHPLYNLARYAPRHRSFERVLERQRLG